MPNFPIRGESTTLVVADTGATDHMLPDKSAFVSYTLVAGHRIRMGNNLFALIAGKGSAIILLNNKKILIQDCLHVLDLRNPHYSLRAHQRQRGCSHIGMHGIGMHVFFPTYIIEVDTATDCHLQYQPLGRSIGLNDLDYIQPTRTPSARASTAAAPHSTYTTGPHRTVRPPTHISGSHRTQR